jgi:hypothetical protein
MVSMAKDKRSESKPPRRGRPPKHSGDADKGGRTGVPLNVRLDPKLWDTMPLFIDAFRKKHSVRLDKTSTVELALTKLFQAWGLLPTDEEAAEATAP